jgi:quercetin dioxygenase-like cupin family protein
MDSGSFYFGNAASDQVRGTGWFVGQFVAAELGLRHQTGVELKWGFHPDGEKRVHPWAQGHGTTIAILIRGALRVEFHSDTASPQSIMMEREGDYVIYGPEVVHSWEAVGDTLVLTVRFPSVEVNKPSFPPVK